MGSTFANRAPARHMRGMLHPRFRFPGLPGLARIPALLVALTCLLLAAPAISSAAAAAPAPQRPAAGDASAELVQIETYLNAIHTLKAHFLQVAPDGAVSEGTAWLERPGRMRFQYAPPSPFLLVAGDGFVVFHDSSLGQNSTVPLGSTPLGILLARHVRLSGPVQVTSVRRLPGEVEITLHRRASPADGSLTLVFSTDPLTLRQWTVTDAQHQRTTVTLENAVTGERFNPDLFNVASPGGIPAGSGD
jgi:outer membrane lipoprotein-sorting protein